MYLEERFEVDAPRDRVWRMIRDPEQMMRCVPGCRAIEKVGDALYKAQVEVSVGPIKACFLIDVEITEETMLEQVLSVSRGEEGTRASTVQSANVMRLAEGAGGATEIFYSSDVSVTGRLGRFGLGMMKKIAGRKAKEFEKAFKARAEAVEPV